MVQPLWRTVWRFLKKLCIELPYDPAVPLLDVYLKELKTDTPNKNLCMTVHSRTVRNSQKWKQCKCPPGGEWINMVHTDSGISISSQRTEILKACHSMSDLENMMLSENRHKRSHVE